MSSFRQTDKTMSLGEATKVAKEMLDMNPACLILSNHCKERMLERGMNLRDVANTLLGGRCTGVEQHFKSGLDVYRFETNNYRIECNIFKHENIVAITAINKRK
jgi:mRNA-degrading endonuclease RelE of RelBE toxin-antitoxin system